MQFAEKASSVSLDVTHLEDFHLAAHSSEVAVMLVHDAHHSINSPKTYPTFNSALFYEVKLELFWRLREIYDTLNKGNVATFVLFRYTSMNVTPSILQRVPRGFKNTLHLMESESGDECRKICRRSI